MAAQKNAPILFRIGALGIRYCSKAMDNTIFSNQFRANVHLSIRLL